MRLEVSREPCWLVSVLVVYLCRLSLPVVSCWGPTSSWEPRGGAASSLPHREVFLVHGSCWLCSGGRYSSELPEALGLAAG